MQNLEDAAKSLTDFYGGTAVTNKISQLETCVAGKCTGEVAPLLCDEGVCKGVLDSAFLFKSVAGQINVVIHAVAALVSLPHILEEGEVVAYASLGAGNTGKQFDLETDRRVAEFKFIRWQGGPEAIRQNQLFKDFFNLAEHQCDKRRCLYVLGTEHPLKFLNGNRALDSVLSKNEATRRAFYDKYDDRYKVVSQYYNDTKHLVEIIDLTGIVPELVHLRQRPRDLPAEKRPPSARPPDTLHDVIVRVLTECEGHTAEQAYLYKVIRERGLYIQKDGSPVSRSQVGARPTHYPDLFEMIPANKATGTKAMIRLRE
jgi:hypothetical protein